MPGLDDLPGELITAIVAQLDLASIRKLMLVSKDYAAVCIARTYSEITVQRESPYDYLTLLRQRNVLRYIRAIQVVEPSRYMRGYGRGFSTININADFVSVARLGAHAQKVIPDLLINFISVIPTLKTLCWSTPSPIPLCIVQHLEQHGTKLDMRHPAWKTRDHDRIASSPCLQALHFHESHEVKIEEVTDVFNIIARSSTIERLSLHLVHTYPQLQDWLQTRTQDDGARGRITSLSIWSRSMANMERLGEYIDLRAMRSLTLHCDHAQGMCWTTAMGHSLASLEQLRLPGCSDEEGLKDMLVQLALVDLELDRFGSPNLEIVVRERGHHLRRLICPGTIAEQSLLAQLRSCVQLRELAIGVRRQQGNDMPIYRCLGSMPVLTTLRLGISSPRERDGTHAQDHRRLLQTNTWASLFQGDYFMLRDLAMDSKLARSIFEAISKCQTPAYLHKLIILPNAAPSIRDASDAFALIAQMVAAPFKCMARPRPNNPHLCTVEAIGRDGALPDQETVDSQGKGSLRRVFQDLWGDTAVRALSDAWHSFPIDEGGHGLEEGAGLPSIIDELRPLQH